MTSPVSPWILKIAKYLDLPEKILALALAIGAILAPVKIDSSVIPISLVGLAVIFFFRAYIPTDGSRSSDKPGDFKALLGSVILPKVMWISSSVMAIGITFWWLGFNGYEQMLFIGISTMLTTLLLIVFLLLTRSKHTKALMPILLRAIPLAVTTLLIFERESHIEHYIDKWN